ncbi:DinB family protein [Nonomuraea sp. NPDC050680]|uniref:DinB family protein n=1 Tax=Nonomuraea sp. NPDC050680 TaxID=3154630 RepID=UPI0033F05E37
MIDLDEHGRPEPPFAADETATLLGFLDYQRATLAWKCTGLDTAGLNATVAPSTMTLGGMLKHLAYVESSWCSEWLHGRAPESPWDKVDWASDADWDWHSAAEDTPEQLLTLWRDAVARSRSLVADALADGGLDRLAQRSFSDGQTPSLRWILLHLVEEYARHNGHVDLLRESVDGRTGE